MDDKQRLCILLRIDPSTLLPEVTEIGIQEVLANEDQYAERKLREAMENFENYEK